MLKREVSQQPSVLLHGQYHVLQRKGKIRKRAVDKNMKKNSAQTLSGPAIRTDFNMHILILQLIQLGNNNTQQVSIFPNGHENCSVVIVL